jgi:hypothetical protein
MTNPIRDYSICFVLAAKIIAGVKKQYPGCEGVLACGDPPSTKESSREMFQALEKFAPNAILAMANTVLPVGQKLTEANRILAPQQAQTELDTYANYAPKVARVGSDISAAQNLAASESELALARGPGRQLAQEAADLQKIVDPGAEKIKSLVEQGLSQYLNSQQGGRLSDTEMEQINRGISQRDGANLAPSAMRTLNNAMTFGDAGTRKWNNFGTALTTAAATIPALRSGMSGFEVGTRRQLGPDPTNRIGNIGQVNANDVSNQNFGFANNALNQIGASQRTSIAKQESVMDKIGKGTQALANVASVAAA